MQATTKPAALINPWRLATKDEGEGMVEEVKAEFDERQRALDISVRVRELAGARFPGSAQYADACAQVAILQKGLIDFGNRAMAQFQFTTTTDLMPPSSSLSSPSVALLVLVAHTDTGQWAIANFFA